VRGRGVDESRGGREPRAGLHAQALFVERDGDEPRAGGPERALRAEVAGLLDPDRVARVGQDARGEVEGLLRAGDDDHLLGVAAHGARRAEVAGDGLAQRRVAGGVAVVEEVAARPTPVARDEPRPELEGEGVDGRQPRAEGARREARDVDGRRGEELPALREGAALARRRRRARRQRPRVEQLFREPPRDEGARARLPLDVAFGEELLVGVHHGVARDAQVCGQLARRGQARAGLEPAGEDRAAQRLVELSVERRLRARVERDVGETQGRGELQRVNTSLSACVGAVTW
jgi:hypothetical protein